MPSSWVRPPSSQRGVLLALAEVTQAPKLPFPQVRTHPADQIPAAMNVSFFLLILVLFALAFLTSWNKHVLLLLGVTTLLWGAMLWYVVYALARETRVAGRDANAVVPSYQAHNPYLTYSTGLSSKSQSCRLGQITSRPVIRVWDWAEPDPELESVLGRRIWVASMARRAYMLVPGAGAGPGARTKRTCKSKTGGDARSCPPTAAKSSALRARKCRAL